MKKLSNSEWDNLFGVNPKKDDKLEFLEALGNIDEKAKCLDNDSYQIKKISIFRKLPKFSNIKIDSTIDLHLKTKKEAESEISHFIGQCVASGDKYILIIHGKGLHSEEKGVLKTFVKQLLESKFENVIDWYGKATKEFGGSGAVIVKLKSRG